jgi:D-arabinose 1-dehydrogenase-like Zn-dependent alcohol dehydrogenase
MTTMRVAQVARPKGPFEIVERPIPSPAMTETFPLDRVTEAYDRMMSGRARFRVVLTVRN